MIRAQTRKHPEVKSKYAQVPNKWLLDDVCFLPTCSEDLWTFAGIPASGPATILSCLSGCRQMCEAVVGMVAMPEKVEGGREEGWGGAEPRRDREGHSLVQNLGQSWGDFYGWTAAPRWRGMAQTSCGGFGVLFLGK